MFSFLTTATTGKSTRGEYHYIGSGIHIQICRYTSITTNLVYDTPALTDNKMIIIILIVVIIINVACTGNHSPPPPSTTITKGPIYLLFALLQMTWLTTAVASCNAVKDSQLYLTNIWQEHNIFLLYLYQIYITNLS